MELTPQLLTDEIDFRIAVRGYDRHEVDDFLERVAVAVGQLQSQLTKAVTRAKTAEARVAELEGTSTAAPSTTSTPEAAPETPPEAETVAADEQTETTALDVATPKAPPSAPVPAVGGDEDLNDELRRTLVLAQRTADTAIREAHEEARQIVEGANEEARRNREAAEAAHAKAREEAHGRLVAEIRELEATRESMRDDTVVLERYLGTERARVRETIQVLRRLVDEPESFRTGAVPELSGATTPAALGPAPAATTAETPEEEPSDGAGGDGEESEESAESASSEPTLRADSDITDRPDEDAGTTTDANDAGPAEARPGGQSSGQDANDAGPADTASVGVEPPPLAQRIPGAPAADEGESSGSADTGTPDAGRSTIDEAPGATTSSDTEELGQLFSSSESTKDWRAAGPDRGDQGPHTQPVAAARFEEESDEAFLAELRRAMNDDEPLGPDDKR